MRCTYLSLLQRHYGCILKYILVLIPCDKWVLVTTAWRVLRLRMEERPPIWRVAANVLNKKSRTADKV